MRKLVLIDGMAAVYRAYYALNRNPRVNSKGMNTSAVLGFTTSLYDLLKQQKPTHIAVAFDREEPTFRHEMYTDYKANRDAMPEEIQTALPYVQQIIEAFRIPIVTCAGYEADDVIGTLARQAEERGFDEVLMVTPDKDFGQLVTDRTRIYHHGRMGKPDQILGVTEVLEKFGVQRCSQVIDLLGLWGDAIDNIPGIRGVGEKTAKKLISQFGSIENMVEHADEIGNEKLRNMVKAGAADALFSKQLATICTTVPVQFDEASMVLSQPDYAKLKELFDYLEFRQLSRRVFTDLTLTAPASADLFSATKTAVPEKKEPQQPTLFGGSDIDINAPAVGEVQPLDTLPQGCDVAIYVDGPTIAVSANADSAYTCQVSDIDVPALRQLMENPTTLKLCHNVKNLKYILRELDISLAGDVFDLQLAHYLVDAEARHTLDFICSAYTGSAPEDPMGLVAAMWALYPLLSSALREADLGHLYTDIELPLVDVLIDMETEGVRIDVDALRAYSATLTEERDALEREIYTEAGMQFNIASPRQLGEVLYERLKVTDKPPLTATKQYSTAEDVLLKLRDNHPVVGKILEWRSLSKLIGTYLDSFPKLINPATGRLHTIYNQTVTATGRLSSSSPNLQNIPIRTERGREIRRAFVARDADHLLLAADYSQIELRIIAALSHDRHMTEAFAQHYDIHAATAAKIYGLDIGEVSKEQRRNAKSVNFGIVYGISSFGLSEQLGIPRKQAAELINEYFNQYPDIKNYIDRNVEFARQHGYAQTMLGRRRYLTDINSRNAAARAFAERNAVNMPIQGSSADMIKIAMVRIHRRFKDEGLQTKMILQVHDELVFDLYKPERERVCQIVEAEMKNALPLEGVEIEVGMDVGTDWLSAH
ncbi:MAG: DNA polymerase I [Bacteroidales bacterium]|nr:DNA polymerase I [Bacteroidales bacterium]